MVRSQNPKELFIHKSKFTLGKRRAQTIDNRLNVDSIASTNLEGEDEGSLLSKDKGGSRVGSSGENEKLAMGSVSVSEKEKSPIKEEVTEHGDDLT